MRSRACCWSRRCTGRHRCCRATPTTANDRAWPLRSARAAACRAKEGRMSRFVWLASQSPRRAQLLQQIGVAFRRLPPDDGEDVEALEAVHAGELPAAYVQRVTRLKLAAAVQRLRRRGGP